MTTPILTTSDLCYCSQGKTILNHCNISLFENEVVVLIGCNGAGKTTLLHLLAGLKVPSSGQINRLSGQTEHWLGFLPDKSPLYPQMMVVEYLRYCAYIRGIKDITPAVDKVVDSCQLASVSKQRCQSLSYGYRQRVGLAQALIHQPPVIFLDEPTNGLDYGQKKSLRPLLASLGKTASVLMISHDYEEISATADRLYVLDNGCCHELNLPDREGLWWLNFQATPQDLPFTTKIIEGRFIAIERSRYQLHEIYRYLQALNIPCTVHESYPVDALQLRIDNVG